MIELVPMKSAARIAVAGLLILVAGLAGFWLAKRTVEHHETIERTRVTPSRPSDLLAGDKLADKNPTFDPDRVDSRPFGPQDNRWQLNQSAAVLELDITDIDPESESGLQKLHASFADAAKGRNVLPSVNLVSAKAKQFDDGLYAALDLHMADNRESGLRSVHVLVRQLMTACDPRGDAFAWLWVALEVGGFVSADELPRRPQLASKFVAAFNAQPISQVVGFYAWSPELGRTFRFLRFLQQDLSLQPALAAVLARKLSDDPGSTEMYQRMIGFYSHLTNPMAGRSLLPGAQGAGLYFLPSSRSRESTLFERLYPLGLREGTDLMRDFIAAIRDGRVDLTPGKDSGWYDHQLHTLESFLLPAKGSESERLLLTQKYKQRLVEAFTAMVTRYRETHIRQVNKVASAAMPPSGLSPRLRVEPNPTFFLRVARSYGFLQEFLRTEVDDLNSLRGAREGGWRDGPLGDEIENMRLLFCGLHLVSCEDIGHAPELLTGEVESADMARALAAKWLEDWHSDPDLAVDTRVGVPIYSTPGQSTRFWGTIGVRAIKLRANWARPPRWRPWPATGEPGEWQQIKPHECEPAHYVLLVDEFCEFEQRGDVALSRDEFRKLCDGASTKAEIAAQLNR